MLKTLANKKCDDNFIKLTLFHPLSGVGVGGEEFLPSPS